MKWARNIFDNNRLLSLIIAITLSLPYSYIANEITSAPIVSLLLINAVSFYLFLRNLDLLKTLFLRTVYILIGALKIGLVIFNAATKSVPFTGVDWGNYDRMARAALEHGGSIIDIYNNSFDLFVFFAALIYQAFGQNVEQLFFYMIPLSLILFRYVYKAVMLITHSEKRAAIAGLLVIIWPVNIVFSVSVLREMAIQTFVAASFYYFIRYVKLGKGLVLSVASGLAATLMHSGLIVIPLAYLYFKLQQKLSRPRKDFKLVHVPSLAIVTVILLAVMITPLWSSIGRQFSSLQSVDDITTALEVKESALGEANTNYISGTPQSLGDLVVSLPYRLLMFAASPFPWQVQSLDTLLAFIIDAVPHVLLIVMIITFIRYRKHLDRYNRKIVMSAVSCILLVFMVFSLGVNNYGTAMRHRAKVVPIAIVLIGSYVSIRQGKVTYAIPSRGNRQ